jgi:hypothetical protein
VRRNGFASFTERVACSCSSLAIISIPVLPCFRPRSSGLLVLSRVAVATSLPSLPIVLHFSSWIDPERTNMLGLGDLVGVSDDRQTQHVRWCCEGRFSFRLHVLTCICVCVCVCARM